MAAGELDHVLDRLCDLTQRKLLQALQEEGCNASEIAELMSTLEENKSFLRFGLLTKGRFFQVLPWALAALAHPCEDVARRKLRRCQALWDEGPAGSRYLQSHQAKKFLSEDSDMQVDNELFLAGIARRNRSLKWRYEVACMRFWIIVARPVEALHKDQKSG